jgi:hypothetical protein
MSWTPKVQFKNPDSALRPTDKEISNRLLRGRVSNTALSVYQAKKREGFGAGVPYARPKIGRQHHPHHPPHRHAIEVSDPSLDRSDETSVAINPKIRATSLPGPPVSMEHNSPTPPTSPRTAV